MKTIYTRAQYMANEVTHDEYYSQFVDPGVLFLVAARIGIDRIKASTNEHFNDIPLPKWDAMKEVILSLTLKSRKDAGEGNSLCACVCIAKAAARILKSK